MTGSMRKVPATCPSNSLPFDFMRQVTGRPRFGLLGKLVHGKVPTTREKLQGLILFICANLKTQTKTYQVYNKRTVFFLVAH